MTIPLDKMLQKNDNRYVFTRAAMEAVEKVANISDYPEANENWKVVPHVLKFVLEDKIKYKLSNPLEGKVEDSIDADLEENSLPETEIAPETETEV